MTARNPDAAALRALAAIASATLDSGAEGAREAAALTRGMEWCRAVAGTIEHGGAAVVLTAAEARALDIALGNSLRDPDYLDAYLPDARQRACALRAWGKLSACTRPGTGRSIAGRASDPAPEGGDHGKR